MNVLDIIYAYIDNQSKNKNWVSRSKVIEHLKENGYNISERTLRRYINRIRNNENYPHIILISSSKKHNGYKMLSEEEEFAYLYSEKVRILKELKTYHDLRKRFERNGQCKFDKQNIAIVESVLKCE